MPADRQTVPLMTLPGAGTPGCSLAARHRSARNPAVRRAATVKDCPVGAHTCRPVCRTVPDGRARGRAWAGSAKTPQEMNYSAASRGGRVQPFSR
jgi:hypothetical protein